MLLAACYFPHLRSFQLKRFDMKQPFKQLINRYSMLMIAKHIIGLLKQSDLICYTGKQ
jgi:hypothetical protein